MVDKDDYMLNYSDSESMRLEKQHNALILAHGYILHPLIQSQLAPDGRIAELAAGTAIWLRHLSTKLPSTTSLHAFDISDAAYPTERSSQQNIHYHTADVKQPFPNEFLASFDVVHIRLITAAMKPGEWAPLIENTKTLLKPGGMIQWTEPDLQCIEHILRGDAAPDNPDYLKVMSTPYNSWSTPVLDEMSRASAWKELDSEIIKLEWKRLVHDAVSTDRVMEARRLFSLAFAEGLRRILPWIASGDKNRTLEDRQQQAEVEKRALEAGAYLRITFHTYLAWT